MTSLHVLNGGAEQPRRRPRSGRSSSQGDLQHASDGSLEMWANSGWRSVASPVRVLALTRDGNGRNWGRLVEVQDPDGRKHLVPIPSEWLLGEGARALDVLTNRGARIEPDIAARMGVLRYLNLTSALDGTALERAIAASRTGWHGDSFVIPDRVIGGVERVVYQPKSIAAAVAARGSLEDWKAGVASLAVGNSRLVISISLAFAPVLLGRLGYNEGFIVHFRGGSSAGKTTALEVAGSVWGGGDIGGYSQSWHATSNGIEAIAEAHCDILICLDELGQCRADDAGRVAYQLAAGMGRGRALADGNGASRKRWRTIGLSTGELSLEDKIREGKSGQRMMAGQSVRFVDLPADADNGFGIFDHAPEVEGRSEATKRERGRVLADRLKDAVQAHYGTAGPSFVEAIVADLDGTLIAVRQIIEEFVPQLVPPNADGQVQRVARHFALIGASGELAAKLGIVPWPVGEALSAAERGFRDWLACRGTAGASEIDDALNHLRAVIERDGTAKFQKPESTEPIRDRLGYIKRKSAVEDGSHVESITYLILPEAWKSIMAGRDPGRVARDLLDRGILMPGENGRPQRKERLTGMPPQRFYVVPHNALFADPEDTEVAND